MEHESRIMHFEFEFLNQGLARVGIKRSAPVFVFMNMSEFLYNCSCRNTKSPRWATCDFIWRRRSTMRIWPITERESITDIIFFYKFKPRKIKFIHPYPLVRSLYIRRFYGLKPVVAAAANRTSLSTLFIRQMRKSYKFTKSTNLHTAKHHLLDYAPYACRTCGEKLGHPKSCCDRPPQVLLVCRNDRFWSGF